MPFIVFFPIDRKTHAAHVAGESTPGPRWQMAGDVIDVFPDDHEFTAHERRRYCFASTNTLTFDVLRAALNGTVREGYPGERPRKYRIKPEHMTGQLLHEMQRAQAQGDPGDIPSISWGQLRKLVWDRRKNEFAVDVPDPDIPDVPDPPDGGQ